MPTKPVNVTVTVSKALKTATHHTHHVVIKHATTTSPSLHINLMPSLHVSPLLLAGFAVLILGIILVPIILKLKGMGAVKSVNAVRLANAINNPMADAVGLVMDGNTNTCRVVALKSIENMYFSLDPPTIIIIRNPLATPAMVEGKPLVITYAVGQLGVQIDVPTLTTLGLARVAIDDPAWNDTVTPAKALDKLINKLSAEIGKRKGYISVTPNMRIGFEMDMPPVIKAALSQQLASSYMLALGITNFSSAVDAIASQISIAKGQHELMKMSGYTKILMVIGFIIFMVFLGMYLLHMAHPHP